MSSLSLAIVTECLFLARAAPGVSACHVSEAASHARIEAIFPTTLPPGPNAHALLQVVPHPSTRRRDRPAYSLLRPLWSNSAQFAGTFRRQHSDEPFGMCLQFPKLLDGPRLVITPALHSEPASKKSRCHRRECSSLGRHGTDHLQCWRTSRPSFRSYLAFLTRPLNTLDITWLR